MFPQIRLCRNGPHFKVPSKGSIADLRNMASQWPLRSAANSISSAGARRGMPDTEKTTSQKGKILARTSIMPLQFVTACKHKC